MGLCTNDFIQNFSGSSFRSSVSSYKTSGKFSNYNRNTIQYSAQEILPLDELRSFYCQSNGEG